MGDVLDRLLSNDEYFEIPEPIFLTEDRINNLRNIENHEAQLRNHRTEDFRNMDNYENNVQNIEDPESIGDHRTANHGFIDPPFLAPVLSPEDVSYDGDMPQDFIIDDDIFSLRVINISKPRGCNRKRRKRRLKRNFKERPRKSNRISRAKTESPRIRREVH